ncbi:K+-transporting ATPase ATPase C chain [Hymenobacter daecheongensis DSM 21074]|uniref:Potassium-transporting ATPase KdpC subunit n=1 Tax=Hymenobacter daecheongensis DSM 21074 TaxID=1121955 RepID=A0A1M6D892_9BACT|nr:potassium-transporting ATPase subunit KdpC [Hymenobacter daecheongensis]SHI69370.1 K+-transporting ATPase ATPase C chain [Hymenobacter daecheongensis DSM 21074]
MKQNLLPAFRLTLVLLLVCCLIYPALVWAGAQLAPAGGQGETISHKGRVVGYDNLGQNFTRPDYFQGRPSAVDYNAAGSAGSNKGPSNPEYLAAVQARLDTFLVQNPGVTKAQVPAELLTASGSGLDPHLSPAAAAVQVARVAKARNLDTAKVQALVAQHTEHSVLGPDRVNVLRLNVALDELAARR